MISIPHIYVYIFTFIRICIRIWHFFTSNPPKKPMNTYTKGVHRLYESISTRCTELYGDRNRLRNNIENWKASQIILWSCTWGIVSDVNIEIHWRDIAFVSLWLLELPDILSLRTCSGSMPSPRRRRPTSSFEMEDDNKSTASTTLSPGNKTIALSSDEGRVEDWTLDTSGQNFLGAPGNFLEASHIFLLWRGRWGTYIHRLTR